MITRTFLLPITPERHFDCFGIILLSTSAWYSRSVAVTIIAWWALVSAFAQGFQAYRQRQFGFFRATCFCPIASICLVFGLLSLAHHFLSLYYWSLGSFLDIFADCICPLFHSACGELGNNIKNLACAGLLALFECWSLSSSSHSSYSQHHFQARFVSSIQNRWRVARLPTSHNHSIFKHGCFNLFDLASRSAISSLDSHPLCFSK